MRIAHTLRVLILGPLSGKIATYLPGPTRLKLRKIVNFIFQIKIQQFTKRFGHKMLKYSQISEFYLKLLYYKQFYENVLNFRF